MLTQSSALYVGDSRNAARHVCVSAAPLEEAAFRNGKRIFVMQRPYWFLVMVIWFINLKSAIGIKGYAPSARMERSRITVPVNGIVLCRSTLYWQ